MAEWKINTVGEWKINMVGDRATNLWLTGDKVPANAILDKDLEAPTTTYSLLYPEIQETINMIDEQDTKSRINAFLGINGWIRTGNAYLTTLSGTFKTTGARSRLRAGILAGRPEVSLIPEPGNIYDPKAIVVRWDNDDLGYIPGAAGGWLNIKLLEYIPDNIQSIDAVAVCNEILYPGWKGHAWNTLIRIETRQLTIDEMSISMMNI